MKTTLAHEPNDAFGLTIDTIHAGSVLIEEHGRGMVVVIAVEEYERFNGGSNAAPMQPECIKYTGFSVSRQSWGEEE